VLQVRELREYERMQLKRVREEEKTR